MIDLSLEFHAGTLERIVVAEVDVDDELASLVRSVSRSLDCHVPAKDVVVFESDGDALDGVVLVIHQLLGESLLLSRCHNKIKLIK